MTGAIILAAGASARLGTPKQTLLYKGKTLLQHAIEAAENAGCQPVVVVLGAHANNILNHFHHQSAIIIRNNDWQQGMGTSIAVGMQALLQANDTLSSAIVMVCDQPFANAALLQTLMEQHKQTGKAIIASAYADTVGVPALFDKQYFNALLQLNGDEGAKRFILRHREDITSVPFEKGIIDIDTVEDVEQFRSGENNDK